MANKKTNSSSSAKLLYIIIIPMLLLAAATTIIGYNIALDSFIESKEDELARVAVLSNVLLNENCPGDYELVGDSSMRLYKGEKDITEDYSMVDSLAGETGLDFSIIYSDTRILTTVVDKKGARVVGTGLAAPVFEKISESEDGVFYKKTILDGDNYFTYYMPLYNSDGAKVGALEICCAYGNLEKNVWKTIFPITILILVVLVVLVLLTISNNAYNNAAIAKLLKFTKEAADGNDAAELDTDVLRRKDDLGIIGESVLKMHRAMREMMDKDPLTKLYNRRSANRKLAMVRAHYSDIGTPYCLSIGDIDFFKKVNDTYGHDAGDVVLKTVASILEKHMKTCGFVARWGGEEFLLVFDKMNLESSKKALEETLDEIRATQIEYEGQTIKVTMSFGLTYNPELSQDAVISEADGKLYTAKESGRNRIIV